MSKIEWTDEAWNIITGCSIASKGCANCYAMREAGSGRVKDHPSRTGLTRKVKGKDVWTGEIRFNPAWLDKPIRWKRPRRIFVCAAGDLFHENGQREWLDLIYGVMSLAPQHQFQILTKRPDVMRNYCEHLEIRAEQIIRTIVSHFGGDRFSSEQLQGAWQRLQSGPLDNLWHGTSIEDQATADERIDDLLSTPSAIHWVSYEPALGGVNFRAVKPTNELQLQLGYWIDALKGEILSSTGSPLGAARGRIDWLVAGGESGPEARPSNPEWFYDLREQCLATQTAFNFKQWGNWRPAVLEPGAAIPIPIDPKNKKLAFVDIAGNKLAGMGRGKLMERVAKKIAGRELDGKIWDEYPRALEQ